MNLTIQQKRCRSLIDIIMTTPLEKPTHNELIELCLIVEEILEHMKHLDPLAGIDEA